MVRFVAALGLYIVSSGLFCCELVAGNSCCSAATVCVSCVLAYPPCLLGFCTCLLYLSVGGSLQELGDLSKQSVGPPAKSDPGDICRWTTASRCSRRARSTVLLCSVLISCLFSSFLFELRFPSCSPPVTKLRNQFVGGASQSAPMLCSTYSLLLGHSSGDLWTTSEYASMTCRLPHTARHTTGTTKTQTGRQTQIHTHSKHAQTHCSLELLKIPKACSTTEQSRLVQNVNPMRQHLI